LLELFAVEAHLLAEKMSLIDLGLRVDRIRLAHPSVDPFAALGVVGVSEERASSVVEVSAQGGVRHATRPSPFHHRILNAIREAAISAVLGRPEAGGLWRTGSVVFEPRSVIAFVLGGGTSNDLAAATLATEGVSMCEAAGEHRGDSPDLPIQRPLSTHRQGIPGPHS
jgi:hypothetical protein